MPNDWRVRPLGEITDNFDAQRVPVREADRVAGAYPYYGASGIVDHVDKFIFDGEYLLVAEDGENLRTRKTPVAFMAKGRFWVNNHAHIIRGNRHADTRFLSYALQIADVGAFLTGSTMPKLTQGNLNRIPVLLPQLRDQRAIAAVLGALDDKIEVNRRMNETLEAMARALFRSWFVDFDPVRAKAEGQAPAGMDAATAALFPDGFEESAMGEIPCGWTAGTLGEIADAPRRTVDPTEIDGEMAYIGLEHMPRRCIALSEWETASKVTSQKARFEAGEILFGKLRPYFHKVGVAPLAGVCSTDIIVAVPKSPGMFALVLGHLSSDELINYSDQCSTGTKMPRVSWGDLARYPVVLPPAPTAAACTAAIQPLVQRMVAAIHESKALATARDALLPKLLSGELRVRDAGQIVERAV